jgi:ATP-dependent DNA ligase
VRTLFQRKHNGKIWKWSVETHKQYIITSYGYVDGAIQSTKETAQAMNIGRSNEISAEYQAVLIAERKIKEKIDNGYSESIEEAERQDLNAEIDFDNLPTSFCPAKPISDINDSKLRELWESGRAIVQRKFDGACHFLVAGTNNRILSRGKLEDKTLHVKHISDALAKLPRGTILNGEICSNPLNGDNFKHVTSVLRCKDPDKAIKRQNDDGLLHYIVFDVLYWGGEDITSMKYADRINLFQEWKDKYANREKTFSLPLNLFGINSFDALFGDDNIAIQHKFEGYVIWDAYGTTEIRWDGKTARKNCYKWKPVHTEDVIATAPETGKGRNENRLGKVQGYQYYDGRLIYVGDIGGGFSDEERELFWENRHSMFPCIFEVETAERLPSMKLRFPVFKRVRNDKTDQECTVQLIPRSDEL